MTSRESLHGPDERGRFGDGAEPAFGGRFMPEALIAELELLTKVWQEATTDPAFTAEFDRMLHEYAGVPSPLYDATRLSAEAGARGAGYVALRLPMEIKDLFREWLETDHPNRAARVMSLVRQMRGGRDYDSQWGKRMVGEGPIAEMMAKRFAAARRRYGLGGRLPPLDLTQFRQPPKAGDQIDLFG